MVDPVGRLYIYERIIPNVRQTQEMMAELMMVVAKFLDICSALTVGNTIKEEINMVPIALIPSTIVMEVNAEMR